MIDGQGPTFIVGGAVRCATGWIRECLSEHPDIYIQPKETHYFDQNYENGIDWYNQFFIDDSSKKFIGEKTASYLHSLEVATRIRASLPDVKLIFCLRDPVNRMYSHYKMSSNNDNNLQQKGFIPSVEYDLRYKEMGKYSKQLEPYLSQIPNKNILIKIYEDIEQDPYAFMSEIYAFVGAEQKYKAPSSQLRTKLGQFEYNNRIWRWISKIMLHPRAPFFLKTIYTDIRPNETRNELTAKVYKKFSAYYENDILELEEILDRDLDVWPTKRYAMN